ncbi:hypothetical protein BDN67DRAFT_421083 [Paxillus ammoniavirescens]|nr:hypothetical protein BDN67DRAFT_421083 [Paxillus ammoniavirescens]
MSERSLQVHSASYHHCSVFLVSLQQCSIFAIPTSQVLLQQSCAQNWIVGVLSCLRIRVPHGSLPPGLNIKLSLPDAHYKKNKKKIEISVDDKVKWSYKWTSTFAPPMGQDLLSTLSSTVKVSLSSKHRFRRHPLGSYSTRIVDFLLDTDKPLILEDDRHGTCATITMHLSPVVDYQKALSASVDASLARLDTNPRLAEGLDDADQALSAMQTMNHAVETCGQYIVPLGQALRLMTKLIDNVAEAHPFLKVG